MYVKCATVKGKDALGGVEADTAGDLQYVAWCPSTTVFGWLACLLILYSTGFHHSQNLQSSVQLGGSQNGNHQEDANLSIPSNIDRGDTGCLLTFLPLLCIMNTVHMLSMCVEGRWYP